MKCKYCGLEIIPVDPDHNSYNATHKHTEVSDGSVYGYYTCEFANGEEFKRPLKWHDQYGKPLLATPMDAGQIEPLAQNVSSTLTFVPKQSGTKVLKFPKPRAKRKKKPTLPEVVGRKFRSVPSGV